MPVNSADTCRLSIQVPESWLIPSAARTSASAMDVTWSLNSDVIAAMRTPPRPNKSLISIGPLCGESLGRFSHFLECAHFNLPDAFTRHVEFVRELLER
jgi:hypothetical protein